MNQSKEHADGIYAQDSTEAYVNEVKPRPRSCVENWTSMAGLSTFPDIANTIQKRWSNININSKLFQAFDRLGADENGEEEYSDSLENGSRKQTNSPDNTSDDNTETLSSKAGQVAKEEECVKKEGGKFRRLQMKWEMMSGKEAASGVEAAAGGEKALPGGVLSPTQNASASRSRIPRLVTSPIRPAAPLLVKKVFTLFIVQ